ncbi:MAG: TolB family protein [Candidatus Promineifilaceae bacterium]
MNSSQWFSSPQPNTSFGAITVEVKQTNVATPSPTSRTRQPSVTVAPPDDNLPSGYIVYSSNEHTKHVDQLYLLMLESGLEIRLTPYTDETKKRYLSWNQATEQLAYVSQDSAKVTFARKQHLNKYVFADAYLIVLNKIYDPILSPDGQQIAYTRNSAGEQGIFIADLDTFTEKRLSALNAVDPAWSPDGSQLVFSVLRDGQYNFMQIDITGQTIRFEYVSPLASERDVDWHPNGQELVLTVSKDGYDELYRYQIDARKLTQLTNMNSGIDEPDWSPDGNHIVFISDKSGNRDVWIIGRDGKGLRQLTDTPAREQFPIWVSEYD